MKLKAEHLSKHLKDTFLPLYLISGDEPLLIQEASDKIRKAAKEKGFAERELFHGDKGDTQTFLSASETMSLFAELKLCEFRLPKVPTVEFTKAFETWCDNPPDDQCLLINCARLDKKVMAKSWYKKLERLGVHIDVWPVEAKDLPQWLTKRARKKGLNFEANALNVLVERVEGNLLAAQQEIERLSLLYAGKDNITAELMKDYVGDNARFDSFELLEACFAGDAKRLTRILAGLKLEGEAIAKINGLLTYELRIVTKLAWDCHQGSSPARAIPNYIWGNKKTGYTKSLTRYPVSVWQRFLTGCLELDKMIKGQQVGDPWVAMESLLLQMSGNALWKARK